MKKLILFIFTITSFQAIQTQAQNNELTLEDLDKVLFQLYSDEQIIFPKDTGSPITIHETVSKERTTTQYFQGDAFTFRCGFITSKAKKTTMAVKRNLTIDFANVSFSKALTYSEISFPVMDDPTISRLKCKIEPESEKEFDFVAAKKSFKILAVLQNMYLGMARFEPIIEEGSIQPSETESDRQNKNVPKHHRNPHKKSKAQENATGVG